MPSSRVPALMVAPPTAVATAAERAKMALIAQTPIVDKPPVRYAELRAFLWAALLVGVYGGVSLLYLLLEDSWDADEAVYFAAMTMSTVGYGDVAPSTGWSRTFTIAMIFVGIGVVFPAAGSALSTVLVGPVTRRGRVCLERWFPQRELDCDGLIIKVPRSAVLYYAKNLLPSVLLNLLVQLASAAIFCAIESWEYGAAMYHCLVTATTAKRRPDERGPWL